MMKEMSETIGVSRPTLSRYFQDPSAVRPSTSKKIQARLSEVDCTFGYAVMDDCFGHREFTNATIPCANDRMAIGAVRAANKNGGLRIAGHDEPPLSQHMFPVITTVAQDVDSIAGAAIQLLAQGARGGRSTEAVEVFIEAVMKPRESA